MALRCLLVLLLSWPKLRLACDCGKMASNHKRKSKEKKMQNSKGKTRDCNRVCAHQPARLTSSDSCLCVSLSGASSPTGHCRRDWSDYWGSCLSVQDHYLWRSTVAHCEAPRTGGKVQAGRNCGLLPAAGIACRNHLGSRAPSPTGAFNMNMPLVNLLGDTLLEIKPRLVS